MSSEPAVGAHIITVPSDGQQTLRPQPPSPLIPSPAITRDSLLEPSPDFNPCVGAKPYSPFYRHEAPNTSLEHLKDEIRISGRDYGSQDLESGTRSPMKRSVDIHRQSKLWQKKKRRYDCLSSFTKKQRLGIKVLIALFIVGTMVGIALGITAAVGGGVWRSNNRQTAIGGV